MLLVALLLVSAAFAAAAIVGWMRFATGRAKLMSAGEEQQRLRGELRVLTDRLEAANREPEVRARLEAELVAHENTLLEVQARSASLQDRLDEVERENQDSTRTLASLRSQLEAEAAAWSRERSQLADTERRLREELEGARARAISAEAAGAQTKADAAAARSSLDALQAELEETRRRLSDVSEQRQQLAARLVDVVVATALEDVGKQIDRTATSYNRLVGTFDTRLRPGAQKLGSMVLATDALPQPATRDVSLRRPEATLALAGDVQDGLIPLPAQRAAESRPRRASVG